MKRIIIYCFIYSLLVSNGYAVLKPFLINNQKITISISFEQDEIDCPEYFFEHFKEFVRLGWADNTLLNLKEYSAKTCFFLHQILYRTFVSNYIALNKKLVRYQSNKSFCHIVLIFSNKYLKNNFIEWQNGILYFHIKLYNKCILDVISSNIQSLLREIQKFAKQGQKHFYHTLQDELILPEKLNCSFSAKNAVFPFLFKINLKKFGGYNLYLAEKISKILNKELVCHFDIPDYEMLVTDVQQEKTDIGFFLSESVERCKKVVFVPYFYINQVILLNRPIYMFFKERYIYELNKKESIVYVSSGTVYREFASLYFSDAIILDYTIPIEDQYEYILTKQDRFIGILTNNIRINNRYFKLKKIQPIIFSNEKIGMIFNIKAQLLINVVKKILETENYSYNELLNMYIGGQL